MLLTITRDRIDPHALLDAVQRDEHGAALLFLGNVRNHNDGRSVIAVRYEAYAEMAEAVLREIAREAIRLPAEGAGGTPRDGAHAPTVAVVHRVGELAVGEASIGIAVAAPHRDEAYRVSRYIIEEVKRRLPVWKQERYQGGLESWLPGAVPSAGGNSG